MADASDLEPFVDVTLAARTRDVLLLIAPYLETLDETLDGGDDRTHNTPLGKGRRGSTTFTATWIWHHTEHACSKSKQGCSIFWNGDRVRQLTTS